ncbi:MAG: hypothetical protein ACRD4X_03060 [Candidatus Acidiferrales bacterium]
MTARNVMSWGVTGAIVVNTGNRSLVSFGEVGWVCGMNELRTSKG